MIESKEWVSEDVKARYAGYDRIIGIIAWLLIALVALDVSLFPIGREGSLCLGLCCLAFFCYQALSGRLRSNGRLKVSLDLVLLLFFVVAVCWFTGKTASPFVSVIYLILMATSLTLGRRITYLMATLAAASYILLASAQTPVFGEQLAGRVVELLLFTLIAHLGALLSGEAEIARAEVERLSLTDDLTELHNMRSFETLALQQEKLSKRYHRPFVICMIDADNLKQVNDRYGHLAGTELIKWTAHIIRENTRTCDVAARFGGDEFIIMYHDHAKEQILPAVERIVRAMAKNPFSFEGQLIESTLSAGVASFPADGPDLRSVIKRADEAMYLSKRLGKNRASLFQVAAGGAGADGAGGMGEELQVG
jgi:diguanylate cyclase (GGDEF)-like protein